jgi:hypothetical protein
MKQRIASNAILSAQSQSLLRSVLEWVRWQDGSLVEAEEGKPQTSPPLLAILLKSIYDHRCVY